MKTIVFESAKVAGGRTPSVAESWKVLLQFDVGSVLFANDLDQKANSFLEHLDDTWIRLLAAERRSAINPPIHTKPIGVVLQQRVQIEERSKASIYL
jgi:hypothetical protein